MGEWHHVMTMNIGTLEDCVLAMNACSYVCVRLIVFEVCCVHLCVCDEVR